MPKFDPKFIPETNCVKLNFFEPCKPKYEQSAGVPDITNVSLLNSSTSISLPNDIAALKPLQFCFGAKVTVCSIFLISFLR